MSYTVRSKKTWGQEYDELHHQFELWCVKDWECRSTGARSSAKWSQADADRRVHLRWTLRDGREMRLELATQDRAIDNLRVLTLAVEAMRLNEVRGLGRVLMDAYVQLAAPVPERDPYEVLGVHPSARDEVIHERYRSEAKRLHPDATTGDAEAFKALGAAYDAIKAARAAAA